MPRLLVLLFLLVPASAVTRDGPAPDARAIIEEMEQLYRGSSSRSSITMTVKTPQYERHLKMTADSIGKEYALFRILSPNKDRGIATLKREQQMWNFFPRINKVIKVPPSMMMGSWMGSDFTNDDLVKGSELVDTYHLSMVESDDQYMITLTPMEDTITVWGRIEYIVDKAAMLPISQAFYDDRGEKVRNMTFREPKLYDGRLLPSVMEMRPLNKEGHSTIIVYDELFFEPPDLTENLFSLRQLQSRF